MKRYNIQNLHSKYKHILNRSYEGSYTIELSLIMPIVLGVIFVCIYVGLYAYDRAVVEYAITKAMVTYNNEYNAQDDFDNMNSIIREEIEGELNEKLVGTNDINIEVTGDEECVAIEIITNYSNKKLLKITWSK